MQPPNLKGGARNDEPWSCYDPQRPQRAEYGQLRMPSDAMRAALEGEMLEKDDDKGGK